VTSVNTYTSIMGFSTEDKYLMKCLLVNNKYGAKHLLKMFPNKNWSLGGRKALIKTRRPASADRTVHRQGQVVEVNVA